MHRRIRSRGTGAGEEGAVFFMCMGEGGKFEHFKSYDYFESCRKTTSIAMRENHTPFLTHSSVAPFFLV